MGKENEDELFKEWSEQIGESEGLYDDIIPDHKTAGEVREFLDNLQPFTIGKVVSFWLVNALHLSGTMVEMLGVEYLDEDGEKQTSVFAFTLDSLALLGATIQGRANPEIMEQAKQKIEGDPKMRPVSMPPSAEVVEKMVQDDQNKEL